MELRGTGGGGGLNTITCKAEQSIVLLLKRLGCVRVCVMERYYFTFQSKPSPFEQHRRHIKAVLFSGGCFC